VVVLHGNDQVLPERDVGGAQRRLVAAGTQPVGALPPPQGTAEKESGSAS